MNTSEQFERMNKREKSATHVRKGKERQGVFLVNDRECF